MIGVFRLPPSLKHEREGTGRQEANQMTAADEHRQRTAEALAGWHERAAAGGPDMSGWPEDVREIVAEVCELWYLHPPTTKRSKAYWILSARELIGACDELGVQVVREYRKDFEHHMDQHNGLAPHVVEGPNSLVKMVRDKAGKMRQESSAAERSRSRYSEWEHLGR